MLRGSSFYLSHDPLLSEKPAVISFKFESCDRSL